MYSVILAAMLSGSAEQAQSWHWRSHTCHGSSCIGSCYGSCVGSCYGSCQGSCVGSCYGSCVGSSFTSSCSGCSGGYSNYGCNGFTGYTVGYTYWATGCYGSSCFGGCYGCTGGIGCFGWTGGFAEPAVPVPTFTPAETGGAKVGGAPPTANTPAPAPVTPPPPQKFDKAPDLPKVPGGLPIPPINESGVSETTSRVVVHLPADARLWVDRVACPLKGETRSFNTPALQPGAQYAYTISVETADGQRQDRRITMTAGRAVEVDFRDMNVETVRK